MLVQRPGRSAAGGLVADPARIDSVRVYLNATRGWKASPFTPPAGEYAVALMRNTTLVGTLRIGPNFVLASDVGGPKATGPRIRAVAPDELARVKSWLGIRVIDSTSLRRFASDYAAAWSSQQAIRVARFFEENGWLRINTGKPSVGRAAITATAQGFMTALPDMVVTMDSVRLSGGSAVFHWTLAGTNSGSGGTGKAVRISGYEEWTLGLDGLIAESRGHMDDAEYRRQLKVGVAPAR
jgi:hypothetical protein